jgi:hypothetical protein
VFARRCLLVAVLALSACTTSNVDSAPTTQVTTTTAAPSTTVAPSTVAPTTSTSRPTTTVVTTTTTTIPPTTTTIPPGAVLVLEATGLGRASFGADPDGVVDYVASVLGRPAADSGWADPSSFPGCSGTVVRAVSWDDLTLFFGDGPTDGTRREFHGYRYGTGGDIPASPAGPAIDGAITVGSTVSQLELAHPGAGVEPGTETTAAGFTIVEGLSGYLTGTAADDVVIQVVGGLACGG